MELALREKQSETERLGSLLQHVTASVRGSRETCSRLKSCVDGCLSRLANYEQRVGVVTRRVASLSGIYIIQCTCAASELNGRALCLECRVLWV